MKFNLIAAAALMAASVSAQAIEINAPLASYDTLIGFEAFDGLVNDTGSINLGQGVTFTADVDAELSPSVRDLGNNGAWTFGLNGFAASGTNGIMTFTFGSLKSGVSAFVSHNGGETLLVEALGLGGVVLESTTLTFAAPGGMFGYDEGVTVGFLRNSLDIQSLRITGVGAVVDNVAAVPEPGTYALLLAGVAVVGAVARRRQA